MLRAQAAGLVAGLFLVGVTGMGCGGGGGGTTTGAAGAGGQSGQHDGGGGGTQSTGGGGGGAAGNGPDGGTGGAAGGGGGGTGGTGGTSPDAALSISDGATYDFGAVAVGGKAEHVFTISNGGGATANGLAAAPTVGAPFAFKGGSYPGATGTCGDTLAAGATCTVVIVFTPATASAANGTLTVGYGSGRSATRALKGTGAAAALLALSDGPGFLYPAAAAGSASDHSFTVTNSGGVTATALAAGAGLAAPFGYKGGSYPGTGGTCTATLAAAANCTVVVTYAPTGSGVDGGTLTVSYDDGTGAATVSRALSGTAFPPAALALSDGATFDFGQHVVGSHLEHAFVVTNSGGFAAHNLAPSGTLGAPFAYKGGSYPGTGATCGASLDAQATCTVIITWAPTAAGPSADTLALSYDDGVATHVINRAMTGTALTPALLSLSDGPSYDFGTQGVGVTATHTFTLSNGGGVPASAVVAGALAAPFAYAGGAFPGTGGTCKATLAAFTTCTVAVTFHATAPGPAGSTLALSYSDGLAAQMISVDLGGTGTAHAFLALSDGPSYDFGTRALGTTASHLFTVTNTGPVAATAVTPATPATPFSFTGGAYPGTTGTCGASIAAGATCALDLTFAPTMVGAASATISLVYNDGFASASAMRSLAGRGTDLAFLTLSDAPSYDFGTVSTGATPTHAFTVTNTGLADAHNISAGALTAPFAWKGGTFPGAGGDCGATLVAGGSCTVVVAFAPAAAGVSSATVSLGYDDGVKRLSVSRALSGAAVAPALLTFSDAPTYDFGTHAAGSTTTHTLTLTNNGGAPATALTPSALAGAFSFRSAGYPGVGGTCTTTLGPTESCTIVIAFAPSASGAASAKLDIGYGNGALTQTASEGLAGLAVGPAVLSFADAPGYDFGTVPVGATAERSLTVTNSGGVAATALAGGALGGGLAFTYKGGSYPGTGGNCAATLVAGASCTIVVTFAPAAPGALSHGLTLAYDDGAVSRSASLPLSGTGAAPALLAIGAGSFDFGTHANGSQTNRTFTVTNGGGYAAGALAGSIAGAGFAFVGGAYPGVSGSCGTTLAAGTNCTIAVNFTPMATGAAGATVSVAYFDGAANRTANLVLSGAGASPAALTLSDGPSYDFGTLATGTATNHIFYLSNTGGYAATMLASVGPGAPFTFRGGAYPGVGGTCGATLAAGATCGLNVVFAPTAAGGSMGSLSVGYFDGVQARSAARALTGTGTMQAFLSITDFPVDYYRQYGLQPDPATYDFGARGVGSTATHPFFITNTGAASATGMGGAALALPFSFAGGAYPGAGGSCGPSLAAGATCTVVVAFAPTGLVGSTATLTVNYNNGSALAAAGRPLSGSGTNAPVLVVQDFDIANLVPIWDFGTRGIGVPTEHEFFVVNSGGAQAKAITAPAIGVGFGYKGGSYPGVGGTCATTLNPGSSCTIEVVFAPVVVGAATGTIVLNYGDGTSSYSASRAVKGVGTDKGLLEIDEKVDHNEGLVSDFGSVGVGTAADHVFTVWNIGAATTSAMKFAALTSPFRFTGGTFPGSGGTCTATLAAGKSCTVSVTFAPTVGGIFTDNLHVTYDDGSGVNQDVARALTGRGIDGALLTISDWSGGGNNNGGPFDFGTWGVPTEHTFMVANVGAKAAISVAGVALAAPFSWKGGTFPGVGGGCGTTLNAGATCTVVVVFSGAATGGATVTLNYGDGLGGTASASRDVTGTAATTALLALTDCPGCGNDSHPADFGVVGSSTQRWFYLTNTGAKKATLIADAHTLGNGFAFSGGSYPGNGASCGAALDPGASCQLSVTFAPAGATGPLSSTITVSYDDGTGATATAARAVTGTGTNAAILTIRDWPPGNGGGGNQPFDYGTSGAPVDHTFYVSNDGAQAATTIKDGKTLGNGFAYAGGVYPGNGGNCGNSLTAGATCTVVVTFTPLGNGGRSSTLSLSYFDGNAGQVTTRDLMATATDAALLYINDWGPGQSNGFNPPPYDYGTVGSAVDHTFTVTNGGAQAATVVADGGTLGNGFGWKGGVLFGGGTCTAQLSAGASCTVVVTFTPSGNGARGSTLTVSYFDGHATQGATRQLVAAGTTQALLHIYDWNGPQGQGFASQNQPPFDYGTWGVAADHTFTISNDGAAAATTLASGGVTGAGFSWKGGTYPGTGGDCTTTLAKGATCQVVVTYTPSGTTSQSGTFAVSYFDGAAAQVANRGVMGMPTARAYVVISDFGGPDVCTNCGPWGFGGVTVGTTAEHQFTLYNRGALTATVLGSNGKLALPFTFKGGSFPGTGGSCVTSLAAGSSCTITVTFAPTAPGTFTSTVGVHYDDSNFSMLNATRDVQGMGN